MQKKNIWLVLVGVLCVSFGAVGAKNFPYLGTDHPAYGVYSEQATRHVDMEQNECAKFVNRLFWYRFNQSIWGNAWDAQLNVQNQKYLELEWRIDSDEYDRDQKFSLRDYRDRVKHFGELYASIEAGYYRVGVIGFLYRYSFAKDFLAEEVLPQTHIAFLAGKHSFRLSNDSDKVQTLKDVLAFQYGVIHDYEKKLLEERLGYSLYQILLPGQSLTYDDYLIEQQFQKKIESVSLLSLFLRKHRNNRTTSILRPVSFSRITKNVFE